MTIGEGILIAFVLVAVPLTLIGVPIFVMSGGLQKFARKPLQACFAGLELRDRPIFGDVCVVYHTYRGFFVWLVQDEHHICGSADDARTALKRLRRFNLTWGLLSYGMIFVPLLASINFRVQMHSIDVQLKEYQKGA